MTGRLWPCLEDCDRRIKKSRPDCATVKAVIGGVSPSYLIVLDSGGRVAASVVGSGLGVRAGELRVGECRAICSTVREPAGFKLDLAPRPKDWTTVAVPRRPGQAGLRAVTCYRATRAGATLRVPPGLVPVRRFTILESGGRALTNGPGP